MTILRATQCWQSREPIAPSVRRHCFRHSSLTPKRKPVRQSRRQKAPLVGRASSGSTSKDHSLILLAPAFIGVNTLCSPRCATSNGSQASRPLDILSSRLRRSLLQKGSSVHLPPMEFGLLLVTAKPVYGTCGAPSMKD